MKYVLLINGVCYENFNTLKEVDNYLFNLGIDNNPNYHIEVRKRVKKNKRK